MQRFLISLVKYMLVFIASFFALFMLIVGAARIPQTQIKTNMQKSAEVMTKRDSIYMLVDFLNASKIDHYADSITLGIAYYLDETNPVESSMWAKYYGNQSQSMNALLLESVKKDYPPNNEYIRYWHGSAALMRIFHLFWSINIIYIFHAILMAIIGFILVLLLIRGGFKPEALVFILSMIVVNAWYVPLALEYTYSFLCMLIFSIIAVMLAYRKKYQWIGGLFLLSGIVTVYFDFLTSETLSLVIPLLLVLRIREHQRLQSINDHDTEMITQGNWLLAIQSVILWLIGYLGMWAMKWACASVILKIDVMDYVTDHISERIGGMDLISSNNIYLDAIIRNLKCLFPYEFGISGAILIIAFLFLVIVLPVAKGSITIRSQINKSNVFLYSLLALVPFIRFLILHNHAYYHYFFAYRAFAGTVMAICFIIFEIVESNNEGKILKRKAVPHETT